MKFKHPGKETIRDGGFGCDATASFVFRCGQEHFFLAIQHWWTWSHVEFNAVVNPHNTDHHRSFHSVCLYFNVKFWSRFWAYLRTKRSEAKKIHSEKSPRPSVFPADRRTSCELCVKLHLASNLPIIPVWAVEDHRFQRRIIDCLFFYFHYMLGSCSLSLQCWKAGWEPFISQS